MQKLSVNPSLHPLFEIIMIQPKSLFVALIRVVFRRHLLFTKRAEADFGRAWATEL
jgi:hypothetical protein